MGFIDSIKSGVRRTINKKIAVKRMERRAYDDEYSKHKMKMIRVKARRDVSERYGISKRKKERDSPKFNAQEYWFG